MQRAIRARMSAEPGSAFIYGPAALQVFHRVLKEKLRDESPTHYLERRVLHRLGLGSQRYLTDRAGNPLLATGWILTARQWAKLGQLVLADGSTGYLTAIHSSNAGAEQWRIARFRSAGGTIAPLRMDASSISSRC